MPGQQISVAAAIWQRAWPRRCVFAMVVVCLIVAITAQSEFAAATAAPRVARPARLAPPPGLKVFAGYADSYHPRTGRWHPSLWRGSPKVVFEGCNYFSSSRCPKRPHRYDAGALRLDNDTPQAMTVAKASVTIGSCTFGPWPGLHVTLPGGKKLILTQTGGKPPCHTTNSRDNFDSRRRMGTAVRNAPRMTERSLSFT